MRFVGVGLGRVRQELRLGQPGCRLDHLVESAAVVAGETRLRAQGRQIQPLIEQEIEVAAGNQGHGGSVVVVFRLSLRERPRRRRG